MTFPACYEKLDCGGSDYVKACSGNLCECLKNAIESTDGSFTACQARTCPSLDVDGGTLSPAEPSHQVGTSVTLTCEDGYDPKGGNDTSTCGDDYQYSPSLKCVGRLNVPFFF